MEISPSFLTRVEPDSSRREIPLWPQGSLSITRFVILHRMERLTYIIPLWHYNRSNNSLEPI